MHLGRTDSDPFAFRIEIQSDAANHAPFVFSIIGNGYSPGELVTQDADQIVTQDDDDDDDDDRPSLSITRDGKPVGASDPQGEHPMNEAVALVYSLTNDGKETISIGDVTFTDKSGSVSRSAVTIDGVPIPVRGIDLDPEASATLAFTYTPLEEADFAFDMEIEPVTGDNALRTVRLSGSGYDAIKRKTIADTLAVNAGFMKDRGDRITLDSPDLRTRLTGGLEGTGGNPLGFSAKGTLDNLDLRFASSLGMLSAGEFGSGRGKELPFDIWVKGRYTHVDNHSRATDMFIGIVGADYRVDDNVVVGLIGQVDVAEQFDAATGAWVEGTGWLAGPYVVARIYEHVIFDGRFEWGTSSNTTSPYGTYADDFDTERWLIKVGLTGTQSFGAWSFEPRASLIYFEEHQDAYTDHNGYAIPGQRIKFGRVAFGPDFRHRYESQTGWQVQSHFGLDAIWDFDQADISEVPGLSEEDSSLRARVDAGFDVRVPMGWSVDVTSFYDGLGSEDYSAYGGSVTMVVPF